MQPSGAGKGGSETVKGARPCDVVVDVDVAKRRGLKFPKQIVRSFTFLLVILHHMVVHINFTITVL